MPRFKLKAFDPHNPDAKARSNWDKLQRGETKHKYDLPPTVAGKRARRQSQQRDDTERPSLNQRRFQAQIAAAKGTAIKRPKAAHDTELRDKKTMRKDKKAKTAHDKDHDDRDQPAATNKRRRTQTEEEREAEERQTRTQWEEKVATMTRKHSTAPTSDSTPSSPPSRPAREFAGAERIPFGFQVDRPPQHLTQLRNKRAAAAGSEGGKAGGKLSMEQYAAERQKAQEAYAEMRKRRRETEKT